MTLLKPKKVIFFGDSITWHGPDEDGFITLMKNRLKTEGKIDQFELIGAGVSGNKIYDLFFRFQKDILDKQPDVVVIYIGINDVWHKSQSGTGTDANRYLNFYSAMVKILKDRGIEVVLCTPSVIGEKKDFTNPQDGDLNAYGQIVREIALKYNCNLVDLRKEMIKYLQVNNPDNAEKGILTRDRVHMNATGNKFIADQMYPVLFAKQR
ncbi:G-D-S-L family lipolytic protein [Pedobacter frigiditerrae]|uniref:G-D-S-L family lipolytic protein n=2 Tax=Pedobacter frigiditerrae TaxID=2530452 RepID=A0A4R0MPP4_9SPHI|nr:G-D-S-L family lipolytic protein [Pedobacter frigiditerrae]